MDHDSQAADEQSGRDVPLDVVYKTTYGDRSRASVMAEARDEDRWEGADYEGVDARSGAEVTLHWDAETGWFQTHY